MACPSVCPQTNRMKAWPLNPPRVLPFSHRPTVKQPENTGPVLQRGRERESKNNRAISTKLNNAITITVLISHLETMRKKSFFCKSLRYDAWILSRSHCVCGRKDIHVELPLRAMRMQFILDSWKRKKTQASEGWGGGVHCFAFWIKENRMSWHAELRHTHTLHWNYEHSR